MNLLTRYILRQNLFLLLLVCGIGLGIYVFIDLFDRLDNFLEAGVGLSSVGAYFLYRTPFILAQIFPAVFLIALMVQMGLMLRSRELLALEACSVSPGAVAKSVIWYALALCVAQLFFSEALGVSGHRAAERIWNEEVRDRQIEKRQLSDLWFREGNRIVHMGSVTPAAGRGAELTVHVLEDDDAGSIREIIRAQEFTSAPNGWLLSGVTRTLPATFDVQKAAQMKLDLHTDVSGFLIVDPKTRLESLPLLQLGAEIKRLRDSGSNIERLQTAWHMKLAYAGSVLVMALIALAVVSFFGSLFVIIPLGLVATFCYYGLFVLCASAGEKGLVPPVLAAWAANAFFTAVAGGWLLRGRSFHLG
ncbi:LptF/LptG family permease [Desulfomicrobium sp. ZS1]|jgi:lipopolysaccharide export system permease protein|uniref:LptF/LptG family permease n=1 Tax=Desulfomicrobium sp. ZS1 TaxID=2952228 RepID=UPI0020B37767|nr:LptF/LptG family permease [Desulfomicrobium sp. ZS1]UTF48729.1 LptF/LptG family permease [Desulfomicrobium sp. ZS1]